jgi:hypothetical protein
MGNNKGFRRRKLKPWSAPKVVEIHA